MTSPLIDENALLRHIEAIERAQRELGPSIAKSVTSIVAGTTSIADLYDFESPISGTVTDTLTLSFYRTVPVPVGYTRAVVVATANAQMYNSSGSDSTMRISCGIGTEHPIGGLNWTTGNGGTRPFPPGAWTSGENVYMKAETGLDSDTEIAIGLFFRVDPLVSLTQGDGSVSAVVIFTRD